MANLSSADAVVIGGGVIGAAVAHYLAETGRRVAVIEKGGVGAGTSSRCEGFILVNDKMPGFDSRLALLGQALFPGLGDAIGADIAWNQPGSILIVESDEEMAEAERFCAERVAEGVPARILDGRTLRQAEPYLAGDVVGGMETACDGAVNPMALTQGLIRAAQKRGAAILTGTTVTGIRRTPAGEVEGVVTDRGDVSAPVVVNAAGVWAPAIGRMVGIDIPVSPRQGQILVTERTFSITHRKMMEFGYLMTKFEKTGYRRRVSPEMAENGVAFVFEPTGAGNYLIGSSRRFSGMDTTTDATVIRAIAQRALRFFPVLSRVRIIRSYAGLRPYAPDHFPIVSATRIPGFYVATGHEGNGITLSLITGTLMAQMIAGQPTAIDTGPLSLDRFTGAAGEKFSGEPEKA